MNLLPVRLFALLCVVGWSISSRAQVMISEFVADNKTTLADEDGQFPDWIELYNTGASTLSLAGWSLTDDPTRQARWLLPATNLTAKGFMVVFASGKNRSVPGANLHTDFNLKAGGEYLALLKPGGAVATEFTPAFPQQFPNVSYGMAQEVTTNTLVDAAVPVKILVPASGALGTSWAQSGFDDSGWITGSTGVGYETAVAGFAVYNYQAAVGVCSLDEANGVIGDPAQQLAVFPENASVLNYLNTGDSAHYDSDSTFPGFTVGLDQDNFVVEAMATITIPTPGNWTFGVNSDDGFSLTIGGFSMSYPAPRGPGDTLKTFNFPAAGDYALRLVFYECGGGSEVELFAAPGSLAAWNSTSFHLVGDTANGGLAVTAPVVSGGTGGSRSYRPFIATDVQSQMAGVNATAYLRVPFAIANPASFQSLTLRMRYDDGFVAFLNGQEVARRNAPGTPQWNSTATAPHPADQALVFEDINISDRLNLLRAGANVLAIQGLNRSATDTDFLIQPSLVEYRITALTNHYFATPTPNAPNGAGFYAYVEDTKFDHDRGFYDAPFNLSITTATPGATIIYTVDGSVPTRSNGASYTGPIPIAGTTVLRAAAFKDGFEPSSTDTQTYIFVSDVVHQSPDGSPPPGWPDNWGGNVVDYGMDPDVVDSPTYSAALPGALKSIPTYSIVTDLANLFDPSTGIYANASQDGIAWERPASVELIYPDGTEGFHINAGLRIRGGYSRSPGNPKHGFRLHFRQIYGEAKLNYPAFAKQGGVESFDGFDLRTFQNYSWSFGGDSRFIALRDQFSRDAQIAQGWPGERGDFYHLYINGQYWGLYNTAERPEASYGESYIGGLKEDYDVIKVDTSAGYTIFATDGNMDAWTRLWKSATNGFTSNLNYFKVQGLNFDGTPNPAYENLLDVDNLIDYMLVILFGGNLDAPISEFLSNQNPNNFFAMRNRTGLLGGFRFFAHDSEHTLLSGEITRNRIGPFAAGDPVQQGAAAALARSNPQYLFSRLTANTEFRMRVADHVQSQFFNDGVFTTTGCRTRFLVRSNEITRAIIVESARWGDAQSPGAPLTRNADWVAEMNAIYGDYFARRPGIVLNQLRAKSLFPSVVAPTFNQNGGNVSGGFQVSLTAPSGTIYYTLDGSDPRLIGGTVSPAAVTYGGAVILGQSTHIRARVYDGSAWSALSEARFYIIRDFTGLMITEIMYHPPGTTNLSGDAFEFIELKNVTAESLDLSGVNFTNGIAYMFPIGTLIAPGQFAVLVRDPVAFAARYPGVPITGVFSNNLSNGGETIAMAHAVGTAITSVKYDTRPPWPALADGGGFSIVSANPNFNPDPDNALNWRASTVIGGSPGTDDPPSSLPRVLINEALTHTDPPQLDTIELHNPNSTNVDVGYWYLTDQRTTPRKYQIPAPAVIPPGGYLVLTENNWNPIPGSTNGFRLDSHGEEIYLFSADAAGQLTGFSDGFSFGAAQNGVSFGRYVISTGEAHYPAQAGNTLGTANNGPRVGPVIINEIQYHPAAGLQEFVELRSITNTSVKLYDPAYPTNTWRLNGVGFSFPTGAEIAPNGLLLVVSGDPDTFRAQHGVPASVPVHGPWTGTLQDNGETLALQRPDQPDLDTNSGAIFIPYIDVDVVRFNDRLPWPANAAGFGPSLERLNPVEYGNDPINWRSSSGAGSPGLENPGTPPLRIQSVYWSGAPTPVLHLRFAVLAGQTYSVQYRDSLGVGGWTKVADVAAQPSAQTVDVPDPSSPASARRFYRIVTPQQP